MDYSSPSRESCLFALFAVVLLLSLSAVASSMLTNANADTNTAPSNFSCGYHQAQDPKSIVASSPTDSPIIVSVGEPSYYEACHSAPVQGGSMGVGFVAYESFPVTILAPSNAAVTLKTIDAAPSPEQVAIGVNGNKLWTWFNPINIQTDINGMGYSNFTLVGAVMPFVPNNIANVSLPIVASSGPGTQGVANLPIEFTGYSSGAIIQSASPIFFERSLVGDTRNIGIYPYVIVYNPPPPNPSSPLHVNMSVVGSWQNGRVGPMPSGIDVSVVQQGFDLVPNQPFYFGIAETNNLEPSTNTRNYTLSVQEQLGNSIYLAPLNVTITPPFPVQFGGPPLPSQPIQGVLAITGLVRSSGSSGKTALLGAALTLGFVSGILIIRRMRRSREFDTTETIVSDPTNETTNQQDTRS
jgi:hypothetical protein